MNKMPENVRSEVLATVNMKIVVCWDMTVIILSGMLKME
jgi:hypothetical protein